MEGCLYLLIFTFSAFLSLPALLSYGLPSLVTIAGMVLMWRQRDKMSETRFNCGFGGAAVWVAGTLFAIPIMWLVSWWSGLGPSTLVQIGHTGMLVALVWKNEDSTAEEGADDLEDVPADSPSPAPERSRPAVVMILLVVLVLLAVFKDQISLGLLLFNEKWPVLAALPTLLVNLLAVSFLFFFRRSMSPRRFRLGLWWCALTVAGLFLPMLLQQILKPWELLSEDGFFKTYATSPTRVITACLSLVATVLLVKGMADTGATEGAHSDIVQGDQKPPAA